MKTVVIIQARMGSTRLPGKVMMKINEETVLSHVVRRVQQAKEIDEIVIATTTLLSDDEIVAEAKRIGIKYYRGSEDDVLSRYYYAAEASQSEAIVRITSDCPLIDPKVIDKMVNEYHKLKQVNRVDYLSNTLTRTFPRGLDLEIISFDNLKEAFESAKQPYEREHVTPYFYENPDKFTLVNYSMTPDYSQHRWTLDTLEDFELITKIYKELYDKEHDFYLSEIIELFNQKKELVGINKNIKQKCYKK